MIEIKRKGNIIYTAPIFEGSVRKYKLMGEDYISLKFSLLEPLYLKLGDSINDGLFEIIDLVEPEYNLDTRGYDYEVRFDAYYWKWKNKKFFFNPKFGANEVDWSLTSTISTHLGVVLRNLEHLNYTFNGLPFEFHVDGTVKQDTKYITYNNVNIIDALTLIAQTWECEWWITDNIINFGKCEYGTPIDFELENNVSKMTKGRGRDNYATRIYAFGSNRNIPQDYRPAINELTVNGIADKRLMMPVETPYIDAYKDMTQEEAVEEIVIFEEVYPSISNTVTSVREKVQDTEDGKLWTYWIKDENFAFDEKWAISDLMISFSSGTLAGMQFKLGYKNEEFEINRNEDYGPTLPNETLKPKVGDEFTIYGYDTKFVDETLIFKAEKELEVKAREYVEKSKIDPSTYECTMMSNFMFNNGNIRTFEIGDKVNIKNPAFFSETRESRIVGYEYPLDKPYDSPIYSIGKTVPYTILGDLKDKVDELIYKDKVYQSTSVGVYLITQYDNTQPTDRNAFSSKKALNTFHRKDITDSTDFLQKFNKGAEFGQYGKKKGAYINEEGIADFEKVVSKDTDFKEMHADSATMDVATINDLVSKLAKIHKLNVEDTANILKAVIGSISSEKFVSGFAGEGFRIAQAINGDWNLEIDNLIVRKLFNVFELLVQEIKHQGGMVLHSPAGGKITKVTDGGSYWKCEIESADTFFKDDLIICQKFTGTIKRYWRAVTSVGAGYINLSKADCEANSAIPQIGDEIAVQGNKTNTSRQSVYIINVVGEDAPYTAYYSGINSYSLKDKLVTREGNLNGIIDPDFGALKGYGLYATNAYLKGILRLTNGKTVEQELLSTNNTVEANRLELGGEIDKAKADAKNAQDSVDNLQIGTRNLVSRTLLKKYVAESNVSFAQWLPTGKIIYKDVYGTMGVCMDAKDLGVSTEDKTAIMSFKYRITGGVVEVFGGHCETLFLRNIVYIDGKRTNYKYYTPFPIPQDNNWHTIDVVFDLSKTNEDREQVVWIQPNRLAPIDKKGSVDVDNLMFSKSNKVVDWSLSPEDQQSELNKQITSVRTDFDVIEGQINANVAKTETLVNQTTGLVEESKQTATQVNQTAIEINQNVSRAEQSANRAETAETNINTKADSIVMEASKQSAEKAIEGLEIGGRNLLALDKRMQGVFIFQNSPKYLVINENSQASSYVINIVGMQSISVSIYADSVFDNNRFGLAFYKEFKHGDLPLSLPFNFQKGKPDADKYENIEVPKGATIAVLYYSNVGIDNIPTKIKLEKGNKATDWTPAPEDIEAQFQATKARFELLDNQISAEVSKTDGIRKDLTTTQQSHNEFKVQVKTDINDAIDVNNEVIKAEFVVNEKGLGFKGNEIDMTGKITFASLDTNSQAKINDAKKSADNAAQDIWDLRTEVGNLAYLDVVEKAMLGTTVIDGGFLRTDLLQANSITADKINVQSLESVRIRTGNLDVLEGANIGGWDVVRDAISIKVDTDHYYDPLTGINYSGLKGFSTALSSSIGGVETKLYLKSTPTNPITTQLLPIGIYTQAALQNVLQPFSVGSSGAGILASTKIYTEGKVSMGVVGCRNPNSSIPVDKYYGGAFENLLVVGNTELKSGLSLNITRSRLSSYSIQRDDAIIINYIQDATLTMPANPKEGQLLIFKNIGTVGRMYVKAYSNESIKAFGTTSLELKYTNLHFMIYNQSERIWHTGWLNQ